MNNEEIIEMYLKVSEEFCNDAEWCWVGVGKPLQMFANLVAAKEQKKWEAQTAVEIHEAVLEERDREMSDLRSMQDRFNGTVEFKPDYNTEAVLVEEMQRMAKRIEELEALAQRTWVGLTDAEIDSAQHYTESEGFQHGVEWAQAQLKEKNT